jgi:hypothetical protein
MSVGTRRRGALQVVAACVVGWLIVTALSGCAQAVPMQPAAQANTVACAEVTVRLPAEVASQPKRETNAQATGAWGTPASVLLTCGLPTPGPTALPCVSVNDVDWIEDDSQAPLYRYVTFGRSPAVELVIDSSAVSGTTALVDVGAAVRVLPATGRCLGPVDVFNG